MNPQSRKEGKERGRAAKKSKKECGREQEVLDFIMNKYLVLAGCSPPLCLGNSPCFFDGAVWRDWSLCSCEVTILLLLHTHSLWSNVFTWYGTKSVWKNQTAWREGVTGQRGCHVCVSVCWEQLEWNLRYKYTDSHAVRRVFMILALTHTIEREEAAILEMWDRGMHRRTQGLLSICCLMVTRHPLFFAVTVIEKKGGPDDGGGAESIFPHSGGTMMGPRVPAENWCQILHWFLGHLICIYFKFGHLFRWHWLRL